MKDEARRGGQGAPLLLRQINQGTPLLLLLLLQMIQRANPLLP